MPSFWREEILCVPQISADLSKSQLTYKYDGYDFQGGAVLNGKSVMNSTENFEINIVKKNLNGRTTFSNFCDP